MRLTESALWITFAVVTPGCIDQQPVATAEPAVTMDDAAWIPPGASALATVGRTTLLTGEREQPPGTRRHHGWHYASHAQEALRSLREHVSVAPAALAAFDVNPGVEITKADLSAALAKHGFVLGEAVRIGNTWAFDCTHGT